MLKWQFLGERGFLSGSIFAKVVPNPDGETGPAEGAGGEGDNRALVVKVMGSGARWRPFHTGRRREESAAAPIL